MRWGAMVRAVGAGVMAWGAVGGAAVAQAPERPLAGKLDSATVRVIERLIDSVSALGVPAEPLVAKALEGATKRAPPERIVQTVRLLATSLAGARGALGSAARQDELVAGANVLRAGIAPTGLRRLREARPQGSLTVPLVVLADLLARGVPADQGLTLIAAACRRGVADRDLLLVRDRVRADIQAGAGPAAAAELRMQGVLGGQAPYVSPIALYPSAAVQLDPGAGTHLQPALVLERGPSRLTVAGFANAGRSTLRYAGFETGVETRLALPHGLAGEIAGRAGHGAAAGSPMELRLDGAARLHARGSAAGGWIGAGARRYTSDGRVAGGPYVTGGAWRRLGNVQLRLEVEYGALPFVTGSAAVGDTFVVGQTETKGDVAGATAARLSMVFAQGRGALELSGGVTRGEKTPAHRWGQAGAAVRITPVFSLLAAAGTRGPEDFRAGSLGERFGRIGVRLHPPAPRPAAATAGVRFELRSWAGGRHALRVWAPDARQVEVAGDMTAWSPASLRRDPSGWWTLEVALAPGLYQLNLRIDGGAWVPPPGLATAGDGFGGLVGVVLVD